MGAELFASEILKGLTQGINQGMQMRQKKQALDTDRAYKDRMLDIKEKSMLSDKAIEELDISMKNTKIQNNLLNTKLDHQISLKKLAVDTAKVEWKAEHDKKVLGLQNKHDEYKRKFEMLEFNYNELKDKRGAKLDQDKHTETIRKNKAWEENEKKKRENERLKALKAGKKEKPRIPMAMAGAIKVGRTLPNLLKQVGKNMVRLKGSFGPIEGRWKTKMPLISEYYVDEQAYKNQNSLLSETLTKYLQGSRPSDYDARRYLKLVPNLANKYGVAVKNYRMLKQAFEFEQRVTYEFLKAQGYNIKGLAVPKDAKDPLKQYGSASKYGVKLGTEAAKRSGAKRSLPRPGATRKFKGKTYKFKGGANKQANWIEVK